MTKFAKVYAKALYDLAKEENLSDKILSDLGMIGKALREEPGYKKLLSTPAIDAEEKKKLLDEAWGKSVHAYTLNFLRLLSDDGALQELPACIESYKILYNEDNNILEVKVTSAVTLTDKQREDLKNAIQKKLGKTPLLIEKVDKNVLAGLKVSCNGTEYDSTVKSHLEAISRVLAGNN